MAPSPENDNSPKAPDKNEKNKTETPSQQDLATKDSDKDAKTLSNLNDEELKALLDEAMDYKNPKDREGKSKLFKNLLSKAQEDERKNRATSAGGSELVRYCNPSAKKNRHRHRKQSHSHSISENVMHGGSLDNLSKEELYEPSRLQRTRKSVSARQREGGSLPCNVNSSSMAPTQDYQFLEEARRKKALSKEYTAINMGNLETDHLLAHDHLAQSYDESLSDVEPIQMPPISHQMPAMKYCTKATLQISSVDDPIELNHLEQMHADKKNYDKDTISNKVIHSKYSVLIPAYDIPPQKKVDENGNLQQNSGTKTKKKKPATEKNVTSVLNSENVEGHRGDIINDIHKLVEFIGGSSETTKHKPHHSVHKSKQLQKQHASEDGGSSRGGTKKQRAQYSKGGHEEGHGELKKSNSLGEISMDYADFEKGESSKVVMRGNKGTGNDRQRERRSWGNVEPPSFPGLYSHSNTSFENLENAENWIETKTKKKHKKRRNSMSSSRRQNSTSDSCPRHSQNRAPSPDLPHRKSHSSVPPSEKSNDSSSDVDSVHSLPIDSNAQISYADIAKNREKKVTPEKTTPENIKVPINKEKSPNFASKLSFDEPNLPKETVCPKKPEKRTSQSNNSTSNSSNNSNNNKILPPDVNSTKSFPAITKSGANTNLITQNGVDSVNAAKPNNKNNNNLKNNIVKQNSIVISNNVNNNSSGGKNSGGKEKVKVKEQKEQSVKRDEKRNNLVNKNLDRNLQLKNNIQNDLTIIQANEKDCIQFNAQMLPPDIPDVQTIEKMHFLNHQVRHPATNHLHHHSPPETEFYRHTQVPAYPPPTHGTAHQEIPPHEEDPEEKNPSQTVEDDPPVVILSGVCNDISDIEFGFDINEQLLNEDISETFVERYRPPDADKDPFATHNHDKIVHFIGLAWETLIHTNEIQWYSDSL